MHRLVWGGEIMIVKVDDIQSRFSFPIDIRIKESIQKEGLKYNYLTSKEMIGYVFDFIKILDSDQKIAGEHRKNDWELGWAENLAEFERNPIYDSLTPKYHTKQTISRLNQKIITHNGGRFDLKLHEFFVDSVLYHYIPKVKTIVEFGCGTGYHLFRLNQMFPNKQWLGLDWSRTSQTLISKVSERYKLDNVFGKSFDYFRPSDIDIKDSLVYTVASLEQVGDRFTPFLETVLKGKPKICIHFEPIGEVLDSNNVIDYLTRRYFEKRGYLKNYLSALQKLENENKIEILDVRRLNYGSRYVEGHSLIVWKPLSL